MTAKRLTKKVQIVQKIQSNPVDWHQTLDEMKSLLKWADEQNSDVFDERLGICSNLGTKASDFIDELFPYFPEFSGELLHPVKGVGMYTAIQAYNSPLPKWTGEYGKQRIALLEWLILTIEKYLKDIEPNEKINQATQ